MVLIGRFTENLESMGEMGELAKYLDKASWALAS